MKKQIKTPWLIPTGLAVFGLGWTSDQPPVPEFPPGPVIPFEEDSLLAAWRTQAISQQTIFSQDFYTWTTPKQIKELRNGANLLNRSKTDEGKESNFDWLLGQEDWYTDPMSKLFQQDRFKNKRFAWVNPWATMRGWDNEQYGDQLIKVSLDDKSIIAIFNTKDKAANGFYRKNGESVDIAVVEANPELLAAVYFVHHDSQKEKIKYPKGRQYKGNPTMRFMVKRKSLFYRLKHRKKYVNYIYREVILLNEDRIARWEYGTEAIKERLKADAELLQITSDSAQTNYQYQPYLNDDVLMKNWKSKPDNPLLRDLYAGAIALPSKAYRGTVSGGFYALFSELSQELKATIEKQKDPIKKP